MIARPIPSSWLAIVVGRGAAVVESFGSEDVVQTHAVVPPERPRREWEPAIAATVCVVLAKAVLQADVEQTPECQVLDPVAEALRIGD